MGSVCLKLVSPNSSGVISKMTTTSHRLGLSLATSPWPRLHWLLPEVSCTDEEFMVPAPSHSFSGPWRCPNRFVSFKPLQLARGYLVYVHFGEVHSKRDSHRPIIPIYVPHWPRVSVSSCLNATLWEKNKILCYAKLLYNYVYNYICTWLASISCPSLYK